MTCWILCKMLWPTTVSRFNPRHGAFPRNPVQRQRLHKQLATGQTTAALRSICFRRGHMRLSWPETAFTGSGPFYAILLVTSVYREFMTINRKKDLDTSNLGISKWHVVQRTQCQTSGTTMMHHQTDVARQQGNLSCNDWFLPVDKYICYFLTG